MTKIRTGRPNRHKKSPLHRAQALRLEITDLSVTFPAPKYPGGYLNHKIYLNTQFSSRLQVAAQLVY